MSDPQQFIRSLSPSDALQVLKILAQEDEQLATHIMEIAKKQMSRVAPQDIAGEVVADLEGLAVEEVWDRSGKTRNGYVDPGEAADEMVSEVLRPYIDNMQKYQKLGMKLQARNQCMGLLLGLYEFETEVTSAFKDWAPDIPAGFAQEVLSIWKRGSLHPADLTAMRKFIQDEGISWELGIDG